MPIIKYYFVASSQKVGEWLDRNMPNPPLPDPQRWTIVADRSIEFDNENDALLFSIAWGDGNPPTRKVQ